MSSTTTTTIAATEEQSDDEVAAVFIKTNCSTEVQLFTRVMSLTDGQDKSFKVVQNLLKLFSWSTTSAPRAHVVAAVVSLLEICTALKTFFHCIRPVTHIALTLQHAPQSVHQTVQALFKLTGGRVVLDTASAVAWANATAGRVRYVVQRYVTRPFCVVFCFYCYRVEIRSATVAPGDFVLFFVFVVSL
jgi:hypothetical protein